LSSEDALNAAFARFKALADKKSEIFDEDLHALVSDEVVSEATEQYKLLYLQVASQTGEVPHAVITLSDVGQEVRAEADGGGPVDASFKAIEEIVSSGAELQLYSVNNITSGTDAQGEVTVRLSKGGRIVNGQGADTDIVIASAKAYLNGLNKLYNKAEKLNPQV
jgi:2-isopropylmalate synthase